VSDPVTGNVPDELTEIGAQAVERLLQAFPIGKDSGYLGWGATSEDLARAALAVVLPVVRRQIADEIEALKPQHSQQPPGFYSGVAAAARVVRGEP